MSFFTNDLELIDQTLSLRLSSTPRRRSLRPSSLYVNCSLQQSSTLSDIQGFITLDNLDAAWVDPETKSVHKIRTKDGVCKAKSFVGASLS
jgi:hypothetical protein